MASTSVRRSGQRRKRIEEVVPYAVGHRTRVKILIALRDGDLSPAEVAEIIEEPLNKTANHMRELADAGSIEVASRRMRGNYIQSIYRAAETPNYSKERVEQMTEGERQVTAGLVIQSFLAEVMGGLWDEKMVDDPLVMLSWERIHLDDEGRRELFEEQEESRRRIQEIQARSLGRAARTGEQTSPYIASVFGFERASRGSRSSSSAVRERVASSD
jgi:DNA-binding transcriptional ArsR family regulator